MSREKRLEIVKRIEVLRRRRDRSNDLAEIDECMDQIQELTKEFQKIVQHQIALKEIP